MKSVERSGKNIEEILKRLSREWGCLPEDIDYDVVQEGSRGVMGIGAKDYVINARPPEGVSIPEGEEERPSRREAKRDRPRGRHSSGSEDQHEYEEEGDNIGNLKAGFGPGERPARPPRPRETNPEVLERARKMLEELIHHLLPEASVVIAENQEEGTLDIQGETGGLLIGRRGQTLDALQFLLNKMVYREDVGSSPRIHIDVGGYRERRAETLENLAFRMAAKARKSGRPVRLEPMAAHERRIIHIALQEQQGVRTESEGRGDHKRVVIFPDRPAGGGRSQGGRGRGRGGRRRPRGGSDRGRQLGPSFNDRPVREVPDEDEPEEVREDAWRERVTQGEGPEPQAGDDNE